MPSWWRKRSSKETKTNEKKESFIDTIQRKFKSASKHKGNLSSGGSQRVSGSIVEKSYIVSRSALSSTQVSRCQSFADREQAQPLPLPKVHQLSNSVTKASQKTEVGGCCKTVPLSSFSRHTANRPKHSSGEVDLATASVSSDSSLSSDDPLDSRLESPQASDYESANRTAINSPACTKQSVQCSDGSGMGKPKLLSLLLSEPPPPAPAKKRQTPIRDAHVQRLQIPHAGFFSAPTSMKTSPSQSPLKQYPDPSFLGPGHCISPTSQLNSSRNSIDMSAQLLWPNWRGSTECSPIPSPKMRSPGPSSKAPSGAVTPVHSVSRKVPIELPEKSYPSHPLPVPPQTASSLSFHSASSCAAVSSSTLRSPGRAENSASFGSKWKKGRLLGRGTFGEVYLAFNSETGEMCAMKEVTLFSDDAKSRECAQQLGQEILLLSSLRHPNIVQYYGSESVGDKLYIYIEFVSGGSIHKLLQEYGQLRESVIRSYTLQILSGLAYLHSEDTVHRDIKGANLLVDPSGRVKLADFGMAKHITAQSYPLSLRGSPYWMAPEVIKNADGYNFAVDIWSLGCTVLEMATAKPPWSHYEGIPALFKIGNSKELPEIPDYLSQEGKDFVRQCLQRNPLLRPSAAKLLEHPFVKSNAPIERPLHVFHHSPPPPSFDATKPMGLENAEKLSYLNSGVATRWRKSHTALSGSRDGYMPKNISCPVSPIGSPLLLPKPSNRTLSPCPISMSYGPSGSCTPNTSRSISIPLNIHHPTFEGIGGQRPQKRHFQDRKHELSYGVPSTSRVHGHSAPVESLLDRNPFSWAVRGQTAFAEDVSHQLLKDHISPGLNLHPESLNPGRAKFGHFPAR